MTQLALTVGGSVVLVALLSLIYHLLPYRPLSPTKPSIALMPKYRFDFDNRETLERHLQSEGFKVRGSQNQFQRGNLLGDFSARAIRLVVEIEDASKQAKLKSGFWVLAFDTGDLWQVSQSLRGVS